MSTASAVDNNGLCHSGATSCEVMPSAASASALQATAQRIANYFMQNPESDVFMDDKAHSINLAAKVGIQPGLLAFATASNEFRAPSAGPDVSGNGLGGMSV